MGLRQDANLAKPISWKVVLPVVQQIYARHCAGCCLHIMTDDGNCEQGHAEFCLKWALKSGHPDCIKAARLMAAMSQTQRTNVYRHKWDSSTKLA